MNTPQKHRSTKAVINSDGQRVTPVTGLPASQRVEAPPCTSCRSENTFVYTTRGAVRYCKCRHCGHSFVHAVSKPPVVVIDIQTRQV
jgi:ribosomal protein L37AE/L43A